MTFGINKICHHNLLITVVSECECSLALVHKVPHEVHVFKTRADLDNKQSSRIFIDGSVQYHVTFISSAKIIKFKQSSGIVIILKNKNSELSGFHLMMETPFICMTMIEPP